MMLLTMSTTPTSFERQGCLSPARPGQGAARTAPSLETGCGARPHRMLGHPEEPMKVSADTSLS